MAVHGKIRATSAANKLLVAQYVEERKKEKLRKQQKAPHIN